MTLLDGLLLYWLTCACWMTFEMLDDESLRFNPTPEWIVWLFAGLLAPAFIATRAIRRKK